MKINEKALQEAAAKLRKLRLTDVGGRKEHPADTVKSVFERGLGGMYDDEAITYALRAGVRYYLEAAEQNVQRTGQICTCGGVGSVFLGDGREYCNICKKPRR